ncbi:phosphoribosylformylglycinamidine synthase [Mycoplasma todarodis]|uniref:Phosphoribosylformylglycinamidine synthase n=1 Tax=Mycoplasma todarodis TaxID=1937191 RepID=A0A4R0XTV9_9MOLU|nr:phosphoribosylformylglycinamidine synthase [Mycoplasma todarodis]TCG11089.1 phosphoribosylformylglycinamidine synthase [Mycoplasma todarodis]
MNKRYLIGKKKGFDNNKKEIVGKISKVINVDWEDVEVYIGYDAIDLSREKELLEIIFSEVTDIRKKVSELKGTIIAYEYKPGQYDKRADAVQQSLSLSHENNTTIITSVIIEIKKEVSELKVKQIYEKIINPIEYRKKDLNKIEMDIHDTPMDVPVVEGFVQFNTEQLKEYHSLNKFSFDFDDLKFIQSYFQENGRDPNLLEIKMLDTYWSDHCRHTTFLTELKNIEFGKSVESKIIKKAWKKYIEQRIEINNHKNINLMDMATHGARVLKKKNKLNDLEITNEINANSFKVLVDEDDKEHEYLLMFKNETHNHPTEIEPFGGASTCLGGAIRDTLSGRAYTFQGMRITGSANPLKSEVLPNKLPQAYITRTAADGFSSYGNQIGMATTHVKEYYDEGFLAKRLETGFVVGAIKASEIKREEAKPGDIVMMVGGGTGRDGIGGATGSSKKQTKDIKENASAEVQKGNAIIERKIQKLTKNHQFTNLIKKSNDFGAGGACVALVELAESIEIYLDKITLKYKGLSPMEIALSESQERMSYVIESKDKEKFEKLCKESNLDSSHVATITDNKKVIMKFQEEQVFNLDSHFISSNGTDKKTDVLIDEKWDVTPFIEGAYSKERFIETMKSLNVASQRGLQEMFDSSIGRGTVVSPYGGKYQTTPSQISAQKIPTKGFTNTVSVASHGYAPELANESPFLAAQYSVVTSIAKLIASGVPLKNTKASYQEYFERMNNKRTWSKPIQSLLGTLEAQILLEVPSIGGKDSMSGTYGDITVPPTLIAFAINVVKAEKIITADLKNIGTNLYLIEIPTNEMLQINLLKTKETFEKIEQMHNNNQITSSFVVEEGGWLPSLTKMTFGNKIGFKITNEKLLGEAFSFKKGSIIIETTEELSEEYFKKIGETTKDIHIQGKVFDIGELNDINESVLEEVFPLKFEVENNVINKTFNSKKTFKYTEEIKEPRVLIPVFPGSNCEDDLQKEFEYEGAKCEQIIINNLTTKQLLVSQREFVEKLKESHILCIPGGFSATDEPDGSGKFIAIFMKSPRVKEAIEQHIKDKKMIIGICNGFQALIKTGLVPYGKFIDFKGSEPMLYKNSINKHVAKFVTTKVTSNNSPWTNKFKIGEKHTLAMSHGEGRIIVSEAEARKLFENGQIPFQYVDLKGQVTMDSSFNPNGSMFAIEGMTSKDGLILGKMSHTERFEQGNFKNIYGNKKQNIIKNGVEYFKGVKNE